MGKKQTSKKSKLLNLREWLTVPDAARYLSNIFEEEVSEADLLRIALDGHLKLSVYFVNHAKARCGKVVPYEDAKWEESKFATFVMSEKPPPDIVKGSRQKLREYIDQLPPTRVMRSLNLDGERYLTFDDKVITIYGVWDLSMGANDRIYVENEYQQLIGGPVVTLSNLDGAFVEREGGIMCQLQESMDQCEYCEGSLAELEMIKQIIIDNNIDEKKANELLDQHKEHREKYLKGIENNLSSGYYPAESLPHDSMLVVRTQALIDLQERISKTDSENYRPLDSRSETTYLNIIGAMLETFIHRSHGDVDFSSEAKLREFFSKKYAGFKGLSERTLAEKFAAAKRAINEDMD